MAKPDLYLGQKVRMTHESAFVYDDNQNKNCVLFPKDLDVVVIGWCRKYTGKVKSGGYSTFDGEYAAPVWVPDKCIPVYRVKTNLTGTEFFAQREHLETC